MPARKRGPTDPEVLARWKKRQEQAVEALADVAFEHIRWVVQQVCDREKWDFSTADSCAVTQQLTPEEVWDTELHELVYWYEDVFGSFPQCIYRSGTGTWLPEGLPRLPP